MLPVHIERLRAHEAELSDLVGLTGQFEQGVVLRQEQRESEEKALRFEWRRLLQFHVS